VAIVAREIGSPGGDRRREAPAVLKPVKVPLGCQDGPPSWDSERCACFAVSFKISTWTWDAISPRLHVRNPTA